MKIIVTIPAFNEEKSIGNVIKKIREVMNRGRHNYGILVVDDGSTDKTADIAKKMGAVVYSHPKNYGLAETFISEIKKCLELNADVIVHMDADGQYLPEEIPKLLKEIKNGNDLVLGSRFMGKIEYMPLIKKMGNIAFSRAVSQITNMKITDAQTGFRAFTKEAAKSILIRSKHTYTQEQIIRAARGKFKIREVPVYFKKRDGKSRLIKSTLGYAARAWISIIRIYRDFEPLKFFGIFGSLISGVGVVLGLYLVYFQFFGEGAFRHLGLMMLDILILSIGLQIVIFGFLADMEKA